MIEYSDFQCPFCGRFARETEPELVRSYVKKGLLRIEWRNFPVFGEESEQAALAGWAAGQQKKFWEFHKVAYSKARERNQGEFADEKLVAMARTAGVRDIEKFRSDMVSDKARAAVRKDQEEGYGLGVTSTPAFLINGKPILGAQPTAAFEQAVEAATEAAGK
jgi:protein-disulfide isomerase